MSSLGTEVTEWTSRVKPGGDEALVIARAGGQSSKRRFPQSTHPGAYWIAGSSPAMTSDFTKADLANGEALFKGPCTFVKGVTRVADLPRDGRAEIAFAGRSNVGKSSLINALTGRTSLARVSVTPGRTRELNFFVLGPSPSSGEGGPPKAGREADKRARPLYMVDMPGYGYARAPKAQVKGWTRLIGDYLKGRRELKRVFLLIDARHGIKPNDTETMTLLDEAAVSYQVVLTKADKPKASELEAIRAKVANDLAKHAAAYPQILVSSARTGDGIEELRAAIAALAS